jgi:hypothetical protein
MRPVRLSGQRDAGRCPCGFSRRIHKLQYPDKCLAEDGATLGLEPPVSCAHASKRYEMRSPPVEGPAYPFLKQNEANPQNQYCSC